MKAIHFTEFGGLDKLQWVDIPEPTAGPGEAVVKVYASGFNFAETRIRSGSYGGTELPVTAGLEGAGEVVSVGPGVTEVAVGDKVFGQIRGAQAQYAVAKVINLLPIPENLSYEEAAGIPVGWLTSWHALHTVTQTRPGERVLVEAVASSVGSAAVPLAVLRGNWVAGTASSAEKAAKALEYGASVTADYTTEDVGAKIRAATGGHGVDVALVSIGESTAQSTIDAVDFNGRLALFGSTGGMQYSFPLTVGHRNLKFFSFSLTTHPEYYPVTLPSFRADVLPRFADGTLRVPIADVLPVTEIARAHRAVDERNHFGKIILTIPQD